MKRPWAYVASFVPFTTASSAEGAVASADDELSRMRSKNGNPEEDDKQSSGGGRGQDQDGKSPNAETPSEAASAEAGQSDHGSGQAHGGGQVGSSLPDLEPSMYSARDGHGPAVGQLDAAPHYYGGGGGGGVSFTVQMTQAGAAPPATTAPDPADPGTLPPDETGIVVPDQADADAMLLLLGGAATGSGEGAMSSGEVVFDIVDYGQFTIGYGLSIFQAQGGDGAVAASFADVVGADFVFSFEDHNGDGTSAFSSTYVLAIDFEDGSMGLDDPGLGEVNWFELLSQGPFAQWGAEEEQNVTVDGNTSMLSFSIDAPFEGGTEPMFNAVTLAVDEVGSTITNWLQSQQASVSVTAEAEGVDTLASAETTLLEIEDHYSSVSAVVTGVA